MALARWYMVVARFKDEGMQARAEAAAEVAQT
jgi:hypothetical protein